MQENETERNEHEGQCRAVTWCGVAKGFSSQKHHGQQQQRKRDRMVEPAKFGVDPVVEPAHEDAPVIRVRAVVLERTGIAGACGGFVKHSSVMRTWRQRQKPVSHRTLPIVQFTKVDESGIPIALGAFLRAARDRFQHRRDAREEQRVGQGQERLRL